MALRIQRVQESLEANSLRYLKILVAGPPGAGKTRSASTWPNPLYADVEGRLLSVRDRNPHTMRIRSIADLDELRAALAQDPKVREKLIGFPVDTLIVDTVDEVARVLEQERLKSEKLENLRMQDWGWFGDTLRSMLRGFRNLDMNVVFNTHLKTDSDGETGRMFEKPAIKGQVGDEIAGYVDIAVLLVARSIINPTTGEREAQRHFQVYQDSAHTWVKDHTGALPPEFPINLNDDYKRMSELVFGKPTPAPTPDAPVSSSVASVAMSTSTGQTDTSPPPAGVVVGTHPRLTDGNGKGRTMVEVPLPEPEKATESVPSPGTEPDLLDDLGKPAPKLGAERVPACADCGTPVTNPDQVDISLRRWEVPLCRQDFAARKAKGRK